MPLRYAVDMTTDPTKPAHPDRVDLRSDTVTRPTAAMLEAMRSARVGDDVLGDDPTVGELEERAATLFGKERALFVPSGTMANLLAIRSQTEHGDEIIAHGESHVFHYETGGYAAIAGCSMRFAEGPRGTFEAGEVRRLVRGNDHHWPRTRLVAVENTHNRGRGRVWPLAQLRAVSEAAKELGLRTHMDGARSWNASVRSGTPLDEIAAGFDTVSACFSKGLGCPAGSIVAGDAGTIERAPRLRKMLGGTMRQSGILAAAALFALEHNVERLAEDHDNARRLAEGIARIPGCTVDLEGLETNLVYFDVAPALGTAAEAQRRLEAAGVRTLDEGPRTLRAVTHLDVTSGMVDAAVERMVRVLGPVAAAPA